MAKVRVNAAGLLFLSGLIAALGHLRIGKLLEIISRIGFLLLARIL